MFAFVNCCVYVRLIMQISLPWILSRKRLIAAIIADGIVFVFLYYAHYGWRFGVCICFAQINSFLAIWSLASYILDLCRRR